MKHESGHPYGNCEEQTERETYWYPGAYCGEATHPMDAYCDRHGGRHADEPLSDDDIDADDYFYGG